MKIKSHKRIRTGEYQRMFEAIKAEHFNEELCNSWAEVEPLENLFPQKYYDFIIAIRKAIVDKGSFLFKERLSGQRKYIISGFSIYKLVTPPNKITREQHEAFSRILIKEENIKNLDSLAAICCKRLTLFGWKFDSSKIEMLSNKLSRVSISDILKPVLSLITPYEIKDNQVSCFEAALMIDKAQTLYKHIDNFDIPIFSSQIKHELVEHQIQVEYTKALNAKSENKNGMRIPKP